MRSTAQQRAVRPAGSSGMLWRRKNAMSYECVFIIGTYSTKVLSTSSSLIHHHHSSASDHLLIFSNMQEISSAFEVVTIQDNVRSLNVVHLKDALS